MYDITNRTATRIIIAFTMLFPLLVIQTFAQSNVSAFPEIENVTITPAKAGPAEIKRIESNRQNGADVSMTDPLVYVVKVYFDKPLPIDNDGFTIQVNGETVREYGPFKHGIYFKLYDPDDARKIAGKEISIKRRGKIIPTGKKMADISADKTLSPLDSRVKTDTSEYKTIREVLEN